MHFCGDFSPGRGSYQRPYRVLVRRRAEINDQLRTSAGHRRQAHRDILRCQGLRHERRDSGRRLSTGFELRRHSAFGVRYPFVIH
jgi:hypothetical protein